MSENRSALTKPVLSYLRENGEQTAATVAEALGISFRDAHWELSDLSRRNLADTGRGRGGVTVYGATIPGTGIPWVKTHA